MPLEKYHKDSTMLNLAKILCIASLVAFPAIVSAADQRPNFILVLTDDQGWIDTSVLMMKGRHDTASPFIRTPNLAALAKRGIVFSNAYSPAPTLEPIGPLSYTMAT